MKQQQLRRADRNRDRFRAPTSRRPKRRFGQRHRQSAIAQIVRRFRQARDGDLARRRLHALLVIQIERRRQSPQIV